MVEFEIPQMSYRRCPTCAAPVVIPFPSTWTLDLIKEGPPAGPVWAYAMPHRETCTASEPQPRPGHAVRLPGRYVTRLDIFIPSDVHPPSMERLGP